MDRFVTVLSTELVRKTRAHNDCNPSISAVPVVITSNADRLRLHFIFKLEGDGLAARLSMMPASHILKHIPQRIGHNAALDAAVRCIAQAPEISQSGDSTHGWRLYDKALKSLRKALVDEHLQSAPETLAAASVLQMHEHYLDSAGLNWSYHARGVIKMLQNRGPANLTSDIERAVLEAQAGNAFMSAIASNQNSFLANTAWAEVLRPSSEPGGHLDSFMRMLVEGTRFPGIDAVCSALVRDCQFDQGVPQQQRIRYTSCVDDVLRMRLYLRLRLASGTSFRDAARLNDPIITAAYAATGFFLIITNTMILNLHDQLRRLYGHEPSPLPAELTEDMLRKERAEALELVTDRFKLLSAMDPTISLTAPVALRAILATILGLNRPSIQEAATLLLVLDEGMHNPGGRLMCVESASQASNSPFPQDPCALNRMGFLKV